MKTSYIEAKYDYDVKLQSNLLWLSLESFTDSNI